VCAVGGGAAGVRGSEYAAGGGGGWLGGWVGGRGGGGGREDWGMLGTGAPL
jgi:hypothetical protein